MRLGLVGVTYENPPVLLYKKKTFMSTIFLYFGKKI